VSLLLVCGLLQEPSVAELIRRLGAEAVADRDVAQSALIALGEKTLGEYREA
jgi:hypothetical protein